VSTVLERFDNVFRLVTHEIITSDEHLGQPLCAMIAVLSFPHSPL